LVVMAFIGLPCPKKMAGMREGVVIEDRYRIAKNCNLRTCLRKLRNLANHFNGRTRYQKTCR
jgi:hypothetical protein